VKPAPEQGFGNLEADKITVGLRSEMALGDLQVISSDHAPYAFDATGKLMAGHTATFKQIANGLPGIEARLPLLFDAMVSKGRLGLHKFVELTATAPAKIYNLHPRKGSIAIGADADIVIWDAKRQVTLADNLMHDGARYTPYAGRSITGHGVHQNTNARRQPVISTLRQNSCDRTGKHIAGAGAGHARIAPLAERGCKTLRTHEGACALQNNHATISFDESVQGREPVGLYLFRADVEKPPCLAGMRRQYPVVPRSGAGFGDQIQRIGIDHEWLVTL